MWCWPCGKHIAWMVNHKEEDTKEIFSLLEEKGTQIMCLNCHDKYGKKGYDKENPAKVHHTFKTM